MKILLDENLPHQLRHELHGHDCFTVVYMGWSGIENGKLLAKAASENFEALLTKDTHLQYEQNLVNLPLSVVLIEARTNDINDILPLVPTLLNALKSLPPKKITRVS